MSSVKIHDEEEEDEYPTSKIPSSEGDGELPVKEEAAANDDDDGEQEEDTNQGREETNDHDDDDEGEGEEEEGGGDDEDDEEEVQVSTNGLLHMSGPIANFIFSHPVFSAAERNQDENEETSFWM